MAASLEVARSIYSERTRYDVAEVTSALTSRVPRDWIWYGEGFTGPASLVLHQPFMDLRPYVHVTAPEEMAPYQSLFEIFGIAQHCSLPAILATIKQKYDEYEIPSTPGGGGASTPGGRGLARSTSRPTVNEAEVKRDLHICVCILNELKSHVNDVNWAEVRSQLYLPVHWSNASTLRLAPIAECSYTVRMSVSDKVRTRARTRSRDVLCPCYLNLFHLLSPSSTSLIVEKSARNIFSKNTK